MKNPPPARKRRSEGQPPSEGKAPRPPCGDGIWCLSSTGRLKAKTLRWIWTVGSWEKKSMDFSKAVILFCNRINRDEKLMDQKLLKTWNSLSTLSTIEEVRGLVIRRCLSFEDWWWIAEDIIIILLWIDSLIGFWHFLWRQSTLVGRNWWVGL